MTYKELLDRLQELDQEKLSGPVKVWNDNDSQYMELLTFNDIEVFWASFPTIFQGKYMMMEVYLGIVFVTSLIGAFGIGVTSTLLYVIYKENKIGY